MTNAIEAGDGAGALRQLALMLDAGVVPEKILGQLAWLVRAKFPAIAPSSVRASVDCGVPDGRRPQDLWRIATDPARTPGCRTVFGEKGTRVRPLLTWRQSARQFAPYARPAAFLWMTPLPAIRSISETVSLSAFFAPARSLDSMAERMSSSV